MFEVELLARLRHPNLVQLFDFRLTLNANMPFLALELLKGSSFIDATRHVSKSHFYNLLVQLCRVLDYLHRRGVVHGDLKPGNLIVVSDRQSPSQPPHIKLLDLGSALKGGRQREVRSGTPAYLAPEVIRGDPCTPASDLYSLGAILYECLSGEPPFLENDVGSTIHEHVTATSALLKRGPLEELHPLIKRLLSNVPERRPSSAVEAFRLFNALQHSAECRWQTAETWEAFGESLPLKGRDHAISILNDFLNAPSTDLEDARTDCLIISGGPGSGKTRILREVGVRSMRAGFQVLNLERHGQIETRDKFLDSVSSCLKGAKGSVFMGLDDYKARDSTIQDIFGLISRRHETSILIAITVDTSALDIGWLEKQLHPSTRTVLCPLPPLTVPELTVGLREGFGLSSDPDEAAHHLWEMSGGRPGLFSHLAIAMLDHNSLRMEDDQLLIGAPEQSPRLSPSLTRICTRILRTQSSAALAVLEILALSNEPLPLAGLEHLLPRHSADLGSTLKLLVKDSIINSSQLGGDALFALTIPLLRPFLINKLPDAYTVDIHKRLARWHEARGHMPGAAGAAAFHFLQAGMKKEATTSALCAANEAASAAKPKEAIRFYSLALQEGVPEPEHRGLVTIKLAQALRAVGKATDAAALLLALISHKQITARTSAQLRIALSLCAEDTGDLHLALRHARGALLLSKLHSLDTERIVAMQRCGVALCWLERREQGMKLLLRAKIDAHRLGLMDSVVSSLGELASSHWKSGNFRLALLNERRRLRISTKSSTTGLFPARLNIAVLEGELGLYRKSLLHFRHLLHPGNETRSTRHAAAVANNIGEPFRAQGRWHTALTQYRQATDAAETWGHRLIVLIGKENTSLVLSQAGFLAQSLTRLRHGLAQSRRLGQIFSTARQIATWAVLLTELGADDLAMRVVAHGCRLASEAQLIPMMLELKNHMARSLREQGKSELARALLKDAISRFDDRSPFDVRMTARLIQMQIEVSLGATPESIEETLASFLQTVRKKGMEWHLASALNLRARALLGVNRGEEALTGLDEALRLARRNADRTLAWEASYLIGRVHEQALRYERALWFYRAAALTVQEIASELEGEERFHDSFLRRPPVREVLERYERLRGQVGRRARRDVATLNRSERGSRRMLAALSTIGQQLTSILRLDDLLANLLDLAVENIHAERGMVFLRDETSGEMRLARARGMDKESLSEVTSFSRTVVRQVAEGRTILTIDVGADPTLSAYQSLVLHETKSILCVPMRSRGKTVGVIYLDTRRATQLFTDKERAFIESFAGQAAIAIENARLFGEVTAENSRLRREVTGRHRFAGLIGDSRPMAALREAIAGVVDSDCNVLISGESGTGKELVARAIHYNGARRERPFVAIDCGALPENLLEAELFGCARGAFTGADRDRPGLIEAAHGGTLFLDEITNTSLALQARLLRVLQEREVRRVGENTPRRVDVRVLAATNADLDELLRAGRFRKDLYYRLNVVGLVVPPLRDRRQDIPLLVEHFLRLAHPDEKARRRPGPGVLEALMRHDWPGNVRELQNAVERMVVLSPGRVLASEDLPDPLRPPAGSPSGTPHATGADRRKTGEQIMIEEALQRFMGDKAKAARFIGWNRQKLYRRMKEYGIPAAFGKAA